MAGCGGESMVDYNTVEKYLKQALSGEHVRDATAHLKQAQQAPNFIIVLLEHLRNNPQSDLRHVAAVLLRRRLGKSWNKLNSEQQQEFKVEILRRLEQEPVWIVRSTIAYSVASVAKVAFASWETLVMPFISDLIHSEGHEPKTVGLIVLHSLADSIEMDELRPHRALLKKACAVAFVANQPPRLYIAAYHLVEALAANCETQEDKQLIRETLPSMAAIAKLALEDGQEDVTSYFMEVLSDLAESSDVITLQQLPPLTVFMIEMFGRPDLDMGIRSQALHFVHLVAKRRPKTLTRDPGLMDKLVKALLLLAVEDRPELEPEEQKPYQLASQTLDSLALNLPNKYVYQPFLKELHHLFTAESPHLKRVALVLTGVLSEGCDVPMRRDVDILVPGILASFHHSASIVRAGAAVCLSQMMAYLQPEISKYNSEALKVVLQVLGESLDDDDVETQEHICGTLDCILINWGEGHEELGPYLQDTLDILGEALQKKTSNRVRQSALQTIGSLATAAGPSFVSFLPSVLRVLGQIFAGGREELKSHAVAAAAAIVESLPKADLPQYEKTLIQPVLVIMERHMEDAVDAEGVHDLRQACYTFFSCLTKVLGEEIAVLVPQIAPPILASLLSGDALDPQFTTSDAPQAFDSLDDDDEEADERDVLGYKINAEAVEEQLAALNVLKVLFESVSIAHLAPILEKTFLALESVHQYFQTSMRQEAFQTLVAICICVHRGFPPDWLGTMETFNTLSHVNLRKWKPGYPTEYQLSENTRKLWTEKIWPLLSIRLQTEEDKDCFEGVMSSLAQLIEAVGPGLFVEEAVLLTIVDVMEAVAANEHPCQIDDEGDAIDYDDETRAIEEDFYQAYTNLVTALAQAIGPAFAPAFARVAPKLLKFIDHKSIAYKCIGMGCFAELLRYIPSEGEKYLGQVLPVVAVGLVSEDKMFKRNAVYFAGVAAENCVKVPEVQKSLEVYVKNCVQVIREDAEGESTTEDKAVVDNAVATLCRVLLAVPPNDVPFDVVVPPLFAGLPLREDFDEAPGVIKALQGLMLWNDSTKIEPIIETLLTKAILTVAEEKCRNSVPKEDMETFEAVIRTVLTKIGIQSPVVKSLIQNEELAMNPRAREFLEKAFA